jgi:ATP-dependent DNA ligase
MAGVVNSFTDRKKEYVIDVDKNTCTCMKWKYQRLPVHLRTCKHLDSVRVRSNTANHVRYPPIPVKDNYFQLVSNNVPKHIDLSNFLYSVKYDGIRLRIKEQVGTTRGGMEIDLSSMDLPLNPQVEYDVELIHKTKPGHNNVMLEVNAGRMVYLTVRVFDIVDRMLPFKDRYKQLVEDVPVPYRVEQYRARTWENIVNVMHSILSEGHEGIVVRNYNGLYTSDTRDNTNIFKVKSVMKLTE